MTSLLNDIQTESDNKKLEELFLAIYFNDLEKVIDFKKQFPELYAKKEKFQIDENTTFNLINLTFFNQTIWFDGDWIDDIKPLVEKHRQRTKQMLDFWRAELGQQEIHRQIEYNQYHEHFFCDDPNDFEEILSDPISIYLEKGFREIDLKLYNRAQCFDFAEAKKLLEQGAKLDIHFENDGDSSTIRRISDEVSFLATCEVIPKYEVFETKGYNRNFDISRMFGDILGLAAHEEMYHLLKKYDKEE
ncbi:MAG: hypothetical protein KF781_08525 [Chitinophagaceae bacterium]|nr:hypothetical protein [Chitinophagaceae bacterium]